MRQHTTSSSRSSLRVMYLSIVSDPASEEVSSSWSLHTNKLKNNSGINNCICNTIRQDEKWIFSLRMVYLLAFRSQLFSIQWITKLVFQIPIHWIAALSSFWITWPWGTYGGFNTSINKVACLNEPKISVEYETFRTVLGPSCFSVTCACVLNCTGIRLRFSEHAIKLKIMPLSRN